jgi:hypothetical protein
LQSANPVRQLKLQLVPLQVAVLFAGVLHAVQLVVPHEDTEVFGTQTPPQR